MISKAIVIIPRISRENTFHVHQGELFKARGIEFQQWYLIFLTPRKERERQANIPIDSTDFIFESWTDFKAKLCEINSNTLLISNLNFVEGHMKAYRLLRNTPGRFVALITKPIPILGKKIKVGVLRKLTSRGAYFVEKKIYQFLKTIKVVTTPDPDIILMATRASSLSKVSEKYSSKIIFAHSNDFNEFLITQTKPSMGFGKYVLFLDINLAMHPDIPRLGVAYPISPERYFDKLGKFFHQLESKYGYKVVIALHPSGEVKLYEEGLKGFRVIKDSTPLLSRDAQIVITHGSTSVAHAILLKKPLVYFTMNEIMSAAYYRNGMDALAGFLNKSIYNIDLDPELLSFDNYLGVDNTAYDNYINTFIKEPGTPHVLSYEIVLNYFNE